MGVVGIVPACVGVVDKRPADSYLGDFTEVVSDPVDHRLGLLADFHRQRAS